MTVAIVRAPRGTERSCKGWVQEAALRMLMNNLDPEVAERPDDLVVYGGTGKAARDWKSFEGICTALRSLEDDETLLVITSDHGTSFRHRSLRRNLNRSNLTELVNIPLFVRRPGGPAGKIDERNATTLDLLPTILASVGVISGRIASSRPARSVNENN